MDYISKDAKKRLDEVEKITSKEFSHEHLVPMKKELINPLIDKIIAGKSEDDILDEFKKYLETTALLTREETNKLNENYRNEMPADWNSDGKENIFARLDECDIEHPIQVDDELRELIKNKLK